ncbi:MAG: hypothetical protein ACXW16_11295, partial [Burkholderiaceae bacterium]
MLRVDANHWKGCLVALGAVVAMLIASAAVAVDHSSLVKGPFKSGPEVTTACLQCHQSHAQ